MILAGLLLGPARICFWVNPFQGIERSFFLPITPLPHLCHKCQISTFTLPLNPTLLLQYVSFPTLQNYKFPLLSIQTPSPPPPPSPFISNWDPWPRVHGEREATSGIACYSHHQIYQVTFISSYILCLPCCTIESVLVPLKGQPSPSPHALDPLLAFQTLSSFLYPISSFTCNFSPLHSGIPTDLLYHFPY